MTYTYRQNLNGTAQMTVQWTTSWHINCMRTLWHVLDVTHTTLLSTQCYQKMKIQLLFPKTLHTMTHSLRPWTVCGHMKTSWSTVGVTYWQPLAMISTQINLHNWCIT